MQILISVSFHFLRLTWKVLLLVGAGFSVILGILISAVVMAVLHHRKRVKGISLWHIMDHCILLILSITGFCYVQSQIRIKFEFEVLKILQYTFDFLLTENK